jgi:hypothetical protein
MPSSAQVDSLQAPSEGGYARMRKIVLGLLSASCLWVSAASAAAGETRVGATVKLLLLDASAGIHSIGPVNNRQDFYGTSYLGFSCTDVIFDITHEISDSIAVRLRPEIYAFAGATPRLGENIGTRVTLNPSPTFNGWGGPFMEAYVKAQLPYELELSTGYLKPRFTYEYGAEMYWNEEFHESRFASSATLGAMYDTGFRLLRNFEVGGVSLPVYAYVLNGVGTNVFADNNRSPAFLVHIEPEYQGIKFLGSYYYNLYDGTNEQIRCAGGLEYTWQDLMVRGEYAGIKQANAVISGPRRMDARAQGFYLKAQYRFTDWLGLLLHYNMEESINVDSIKAFGSTPGVGSLYKTFVPCLQIYLIPQSIIFVQYDITDERKKDDSDIVRYNHLTVGWKTVF